MSRKAVFMLSGAAGEGLPRVRLPLGGWLRENSRIESESGEYYIMKSTGKLPSEEYRAAVADIMRHPIFQSMDQYCQHGKTTCKDHCIRVSWMTWRMCVRMGWDCRQGARAALLHDLFLYDWHTRGRLTGERFHGFTHPRTALNNAEKYFNLTEAEKNMILRHMWPLTPIPPATREGMALCLADKICSLGEVGANVKDWIRTKTGAEHDILGKTI